MLFYFKIFTKLRKFLKLFCLFFFSYTGCAFYINPDCHNSFHDKPSLLGVSFFYYLNWHLKSLSWVWGEIKLKFIQFGLCEKKWLNLQKEDEFTEKTPVNTANEKDMLSTLWKISTEELFHHIKFYFIILALTLTNFMFKNTEIDESITLF